MTSYSARDKSICPATAWRHLRTRSRTFQFTTMMESTGPLAMYLPEKVGAEIAPGCRRELCDPRVQRLVLVAQAAPREALPDRVLALARGKRLRMRHQEREPARQGAGFLHVD